MALSSSAVPVWLKQAVGSARSQDDHLKGLLVVCKEFGVSPIEAFGGELKVSGRIGDQDVDLKIEYPGMSGVLFNDMIQYLVTEAKEKEKAQKKASSKKR